MTRALKIAIIIMALINSLIPSTSALVDNDLTIDIPLQSLNSNQAIDLTGLISTQTVEIPIPGNWKITDQSWLEMDITASELLDLTNSALTISLNGLQVKSLKLEKIINTTQKIELPANFFKQGTNTLTFSGTLYLPDDLVTNCKGWDDPSRWLLIGPQSNIHIGLQKQIVASNLSHVPEVFLQPLERYLTSGADPLLFVLPDNISQDDLNTLSATSFFLGHEGGEDFVWDPQILTESEFNNHQNKDGNIIFINNIPAQFQANISTQKNAIALFPSPWGENKNILILFDQDREDGYSPALVFGDPTRSILLNGNIAYLDTAEQITPPPFKNNYSFEELGYLDRTIRGLGKGNLIYRVYIPYNIKPTSADLSLQLAHSPDLDVKTSSFAIYLNGFTVASILPTAQSANLEPIQIDLPPNRFRPGVNFVRFSFDLYLPYSRCDKAPDSVWATIFNQTTLEVTYREGTPTASLKYFPMPFNDYARSSFVIPDQPDHQTLNKVARLAFAIGGSSYYANKPPSILTATKYLASQPNHENFIFIGSGLDNPAIKNVNDFLPQPFTKDMTHLQDGFGVYLPSADQDASTGLLQIIPSPWGKDETILILTGTNSQGINWAWDVLLDSKIRSQFSGNLMVIGSAKKTNSISIAGDQNPDPYFQQTPVVINIPIIGKFLQKYGQSGSVSALIAIVIAGISILLIIRVSSLAMTYEIRKKNPPKSETEEQE